MNLKNLIMWALIILLSVGLFNMFQDPEKNRSTKNTVSFSKFLEEVDNGRVVEVKIQGNNISGVMSDGNNFTTYSPNYPNLVERLSDKGVSIVAAPLEDKMPLTDGYPAILVSNVASNWGLDIFYASNARRQRWCHGLW